jgi:hypothetical protein
LKIHHSAISPDTTLNRLDLGEREAIALAETLRADAILIDERDGRRVAEQRHLTVIGTLQILDTAAENGLIDLPTVLDQLQSTTFRVSTRLLKIFSIVMPDERNAPLPAAETPNPCNGLAALCSLTSKNPSPSSGTPLIMQVRRLSATSLFIINGRMAEDSGSFPAPTIHLRDTLYSLLPPSEIASRVEEWRMQEGDSPTPESHATTDEPLPEFTTKRDYW